MAKGMTTIIGREKLCRSHAGAAQLPPIAYMALGTGGLISNDESLPVIGNETSLRQEVLRKVIDKTDFPISTTGRYQIILEKEELAGVYISELGLIDEEGDLIVYKTFLPKVKDDDMEFCFTMDEIF